MNRVKRDLILDKIREYGRLQGRFIAYGMHACMADDAARAADEYKSVMTYIEQLLEDEVDK